MKKSQALASLKRYAAALQRMGATRLYLFGSTARDTATAQSDVDLFLDYDARSGFSALDLVAAQKLLEKGLGVPVDITTRAGLHPLIRKQVERGATRVF